MSDHPAFGHRSAEYIRYMASDAWADLRVRYFRSRAMVCGGCKMATPRLDLHHRTYRRFGHEALADLVALCRTCHERVHMLVRRGVHLGRATDSVAARRPPRKARSSVRRYASGKTVGSKAGRIARRARARASMLKTRSQGGLSNSDKRRLVSEARARLSEERSGLAQGLDMP